MKGKATNAKQINAARMLLGWTAADLAEGSDVRDPTIQRLDATIGPVGGRRKTVEAIRKALEAKDVQFPDAGSVAVGPGGR